MTPYKTPRRKDSISDWIRTAAALWFIGFATWLLFDELYYVEESIEVKIRELVIPEALQEAESNG